ncbi:TetR/AcrR family transcriptional regulator [Curtobacterium sp. MCBD17_003]|uniref:TetR/AcrR family transcriptional regulator n=1 Tax=Curtobacterium sp. MCBD17_003 TaxID=2175667 RepID=UPI001C648AC0|nr:TetR/AcrR family transcriptional regulator [Curtobacterium sp. MCBD17_003]WIE53996.1 TetR/AcrR family transcriptional regulator [Curtobacterium sp. MCBD17_003]
MDLVKTRRRGPELEEALLDAAWEELQAVGYPALTFEGVAARAGTSKPVLYRRWPAKVDLVLAALQHGGLFSRRELVDTGSLRGDVLHALRDFNAYRSGFMAAISVYMASINAETGLSPADLRERLLGGRSSMGRVMLERAAARGEIPARDWPDGVASLPSDLVRHDLVMSLKPLPDRRIVEIVDDIWLPLVRE